MVPLASRLSKFSVSRIFPAAFVLAVASATTFVGLYSTLSGCGGCSGVGSGVTVFSGSFAGAVSCAGCESFVSL